MPSRDGGYCRGCLRNTAVTPAELPSGTWLRWVWKSRGWQQRIYLWINAGRELGPYAETFVLEGKEVGLSVHSQVLS